MLCFAQTEVIHAPGLGSWSTVSLVPFSRDLCGTFSSPSSLSANATFSEGPPEALLYHSIPFTSTNHTSRSNLALYFIHLAIGLHVEESRDLLAFVAPSTPSLSVNRAWLSGGWEHLCTSLGHQAGSREVSPSGNASDATHGLQTPTLAYQPLSPMCSGPGEAVGGRGSCLQAKSQIGVRVPKPFVAADG